VTALNNTARAVVPAAPAIQEGGKASGAVSGPQHVNRG
jgi:hypothetical protein